MFSVSIPVQEMYLNAAKRADVRWLEIHGAERADQDGESQRRYLQAAREKIDRHGLQVATIHFCYTEPWLGSRHEDRNQLVMNHVFQTMELGLEYFPQAMYVLHPGELIEVPELADRQRRRARELVREIGRRAERYGVKVAVENMRKSDPTEPPADRVGQEMEWILATIEGYPSFGVCLDTGHANISGNVIHMARSAGDKLLVVHLSDNFGIYDDHLFPGKGKISWPELGKILGAGLGFQGPMTLEIHLPTEEDKIVKVLEQGRAFVTALLTD